MFIASFLFTLFISAVVIAGAVAVAFAVGASAVKKKNKERNQVVPGISSNAPQSWTGSHSTEARLHRRIRDAVAGIHSLDDSDGTIAATVASVDQDALSIDNQLIAASHLAPKLKKQLLKDLDQAVSQLEEIAAQVIGRGASGSQRSVEEQLGDLSDRLESMRLARAEVDEADERGQSGTI